MLTDEGQKKITVTTVDGREHTFEPREGDEMVGIMQTGMFIVFERIDLVQTSDGLFRPNKAKAVIKVDKKRVLFERAMFSPHTILRIDFDKPDIEEQSLIQTIDKKIIH